MLEPDVRGQLQLLQCEVAFRRALAGLPVDDLVAKGLGLDPRCQPLRAAALIAAQHEGRWERGDAAGALKAFEELARLEPGNAELHSKAAAARTLITSGR